MSPHSRIQTVEQVMADLHRSSTHDADRPWKIRGWTKAEYYKYTEQYIRDFDKSGKLSFHKDIRDLPKEEQIEIKSWVIHRALKKHQMWLYSARNPPPWPTQLEAMEARHRKMLLEKEWSEELEAEERAADELAAKEQAAEELAAKEQEAEKQACAKRLAAERVKESRSEACRSRRKSSRLAWPDARTMKPRRMPSSMP